MTLVTFADSTSLVVAKSPLIIPSSSSPPPLINLTSSLQQPEIPHCADYPLDALINEFAKYLDCNGWLRSGIELPSLPKISPERLRQIDVLLNQPKLLHIKLPNRNVPITLTLKEIFDVLNTKNQLRGGYLRFLLSSAWYFKALSLLNENLNLQLLGDKFLGSINVLPRDIDFRNLAEGGRTCEEVAEAVVSLIANKIPKDSHNYSYAELCNFIRRRGSAFEDFDKVFAIEDGELKTDALLLGLDGGGDDPDVDLLIAAKFENENAALTTVQDLWIDLEDPAVPKGINSEGWQSVLDATYKILHLKKSTPKAFTTAISSMIKQYRCPEALSPKIFENLRRHCSMSKFPASRTLAKLLKMELKKHHKDPTKTGIPFTFMAVALLQRNGFSSEESSQLWKCMSQSLHEHDHLIIGDSTPNSALNALHAAGLKFPFELVDAIVQVQQFIRLNRARDKEDLDNGIFLRVNEKKYTVMSLFNRAALTVPCNPAAALETIVWFLNQSPVLLDSDQRKTLVELISSFSTNQGYVFNDRSPIKETLNCQTLNIPSILKSAQLLLNSPIPELKKMGYQLAMDCYGLNSSNESLEILLSYLPEIIAIETDKSHLKNLLLFLDEQVSKRSLRTKIIGAAFSYLQGLQDQIEANKDPYDLCIKRMIASGDELLLKTAYKVLLRKAKGIPQEKKAKSLIRFAFLTLDKQPEKALAIVEKHLEDCNFDSEDLSIFIKKYVNIQSDSKASQKDTRKITIILKHLISKQPALKKDLAFFFFSKFKELMDRDISYGFGLMLNIAKECSLFNRYEELPGIWLQYCEAQFYKENPDLMILMKKWKEAEALHLWNPKKTFKAHRQFLVDFAEKLYALNLLESDTLANTLVNILEAHPYKDEQSDKITQLTTQRTSRKLNENRDQEELVHKVDTLVSLLAKGIDHTQRHQYRKVASGLIEKLNQPHPNKNIYSANLSKARTFLEKPFLRELFSDNRTEFQRMLILCLDRYYTLWKSKDEHSKIYSLLETLLNVTFNENSNVEHLPTVLTLQRFIACEDFEYIRPLSLVLKNHLKSVLTSLDLKGKHTDVLELTCKFMSEYRLIDSNLTHLNEILRRNVQCELKGFTNKIKAIDYLSDTSSDNGEGFKPSHDHKKRLQSDQRYNNVFQCLPFIMMGPELKQEFLTSILDSLMVLEAHAESLPWVDRLLELEKTKAKGATNESTSLTLLNAGMELSLAGYNEKSMAIFKILYKRYVELHQDILGALVQNPEELVKPRPRTYAKILQRTFPLEQNPLFNKRNVVAVSKVLSMLVKPNAQPKDLNIALKFYEIWPTALQFPFKPILAQILSCKDLDLKRRASNLLPFRVNALPDLAIYPSDSSVVHDWKDNWKISWRLLRDLWKSTNEEVYKGELLNQLQSLVDLDSDLLNFLRKVSKEDLRLLALEHLVPITSELIDDIPANEKLLEQMIELKDAAALARYKKLQESLNEVFITIFGKTMVPEEYLFACKSLKEIIQMYQGNLSGKPVTLFINLLKKAPTNLGEISYSIFLALNEIVRQFQKSELTTEEIVRLAEALHPYQKDIAQATNWIAYAKKHPGANKLYKARLDKMDLRDSGGNLKNSVLKFGRGLIILALSSQIYRRWRNHNSDSTDLLLIFLLIFFVKISFSSQKTEPK